MPNALAVLLMPVLLLAGAAALDGGLYALPAKAQALLPQGPYIAGAVGMALGLWFHRARAVFALIVLAGAYWVLTVYLPGREATGVYAAVLYPALACLVPLNIAFFSLMDERGVFSGHGISRLVFIAVQALALVMMTGQGLGFGGLPEGWRLGLEGFLNTPWLTIPGTAATPLPENAVIVFAAAALWLSFRVLAVGGPLDGGLLVALIAAAIGFHRAGLGGDAAPWFTAAALILLMAVMHAGYRMAFIDELTGLPGRRALMTRMKKAGGTLTAAMVDVDHFKKFNDTHGHDVGDQVLRMVAGRLKRVSGGGKSYRYGGEEFTVLFPGKAMDDAEAHLEKLRAAIADTPFAIRTSERPKQKPKRGEKPKVKADTARVTVSIGYADRAAIEGDMDPDALLKAADKALYRAKDGGRNRVSG